MQGAHCPHQGATPSPFLSQGKVSRPRTPQKGGEAPQRNSNWAENSLIADVSDGDRAHFPLMSTASPPPTLCLSFARAVCHLLVVLVPILCLLAVAVTSTIVQCQISPDGLRVAITLRSIAPSASRLDLPRRAVLPPLPATQIARAGAPGIFAYLVGGGGGFVPSGPREAVMSCCCQR